MAQLSTVRGVVMQTGGLPAARPLTYLLARRGLLGNGDAAVRCSSPAVPALFAGDPDCEGVTHMEDPSDALHDPDPAADKRRCYTVRRSVALSAYWYDRVRQVATSSNLKPGVILRNAIKLGLVQLEKRARPEGKRTP